MDIVPRRSRNAALANIAARVAARAGWRYARYAYNRYARGARTNRAKAARRAKRTARRRMSKRGRYIRRKFYRVSRPRSIKRAVKQLQIKANEGVATHTHKYAQTGKFKTGGFSTSSLDSVIGHNWQTIQGAIDSLRFYDATTNALLTKDIETNTYHQEILINSLYCKLHLRNNYFVPVTVDVYLLSPKVDTSTDPETSFSNGITDQAVGTVSTSDPLIYPTDSKEFMDTWKILYHKRQKIDIQKDVYHYYSMKNIMYDPAYYDSHSGTYQKRCRTRVWLVRCVGTLAHDVTVGTEQGLDRGGVDYEIKTIYKINYDAGVKLNDISLNTNYDSFTNQAAIITNDREINQAPAVL